MNRLLFVLIASIGLGGCAELSEYNQKLANWAGEQIKIRDRYKQNFSDETTSTKDIDTVYVRIKKEFGFTSAEEDAKGCTGVNNTTCNLKAYARSLDKPIHEKTPGVFYRMADTFNNSADENQPFYLDVTLGKNGKKTEIEWKVRGDEAFAERVKQRMLKAVK